MGRMRHIQRRLGARILLLGAAFMSGAPAAGQGLPNPGGRAGVEVHESTIPQLHQALLAGRTTAVALVDAHLARIAAYDVAGPRLNAVLVLNPAARSEAESLDRELAERGPRGPMHGIPILLKDNFDVAGLPTTGGSVALAALMPAEDAYLVGRLRAAGAVILGKTNLHELASGITNVSSLGGQTRNPYDPARNPGGSSGGTGAAIAASLAVIGWGSDTCGSIRIPAAHASLFGLRATPGLFSAEGVMPLARSQDVVGPLGRTAMDLAIALDATAGLAPGERPGIDGEIPPPLRFVEALEGASLRGARIGVLRQHFGIGPEEREFSAVARAALDRMAAEGAEIVDIEIPGLDEMLDASAVIDYEFKTDFARYLAGKPNPPVRTFVEIVERGLYHAALEERFLHRSGTPTRESQAYHDAMARRVAVRELVLSVLERERLDAIAYPPIRREPARIPDPQFGQNCQLAASTAFPALSMPAGFTAGGLAVGLELLGRPSSDARLLALGHAFERAASPRRPPATTPPLDQAAPPAPVRFSALEPASPPPPDSPRVRAGLALDPTTDGLRYGVGVEGIAAAEVVGFRLHRGSSGGAGPVLLDLGGRGSTAASGTLELVAGMRDLLLRGDFHLAVHVTDPAKSVRVPLGSVGVAARP